jgi:hypothetical protein
MATTRTKAARPKAPDLTHRDDDHPNDHDRDHDRDRGANIVLSIKLGPMVSFQIEGPNCTEITGALKGFEQLNHTVDAMFSDLAKRVYPDTDHAGPSPTGKEKA